MRTLEQIIQDTKEEWDRDSAEQIKELSDLKKRFDSEFSELEQKSEELGADLNKTMDKYGITINDTSIDCRIQSDSSRNGRREPTQQQDQRPSVHRAGTQSANRELATEER